MSMATKESITQSLRGVIDPASKRDVVSLGLLRGVALCDGVAKVTYQVPADIAPPSVQKALNDQTRTVVAALPGVKSVEVEINVVAGRPANTLPGVRNVIAVGAGKGGVGKSTVSVLLAVGLQRLGFRTGILDADVYGPSIPKLTGTENAQPMVDSDGRLVPPTRDGMPIMSMGYLVSPNQAVIWRGPMAQKYVKDFIERGSWGELDHLIVDLPPGTGDIPLTLAQSIPLTGAVIVCTPQDVALLDAIKALHMYQKLGVEPLGIVENMSYYVCPQCGHREHIFDHGGCEQAAKELDVPFLGNIPLNIAIRRYGDAGTPGDYFTKTEGYVADAIENVVKRLAEEIDRRVKQRMPLPQLTVRD